MQVTHSFLIQAKPALFEVLKHEKSFLKHLARDVILRLDQTDRHNLDFERIYVEVKAAYLKSVRKLAAGIDETLGFDHYWTFEKSEFQVIAFAEVLDELGLTEPGTGVPELDHLIQIHHPNGT
jgi:hypothetical protein